ncbi:transcriptional coactivator p15/PC4 family protein [Burkholderia vietnamiensis]|uniref:transcriptional coactivator p15/PC4 family protein n=1 Tax=Burkholderia vietnamiensis TaxID=60552 RepID=UPI00264CD29C|nr:transcriptional coactivator p15/PC4 family protein [Burkholderia vietnamiensis]MDN8065942.1 transcriptional coactivator p15/PC4 family protein [Burkholderia vietnamiensis]
MTIPTTQNEKGRDSGKSATQTTRRNDTSAVDYSTCFLDARRSDSERLRVTVSEYRGRTLVDLRIWFSTESGEFKPGRAGVSLRPEQVGEVMQALRLAAQAADPKGAN